MQWVKTVLHELFGLFVDDGSFALLMIVWLGAAWLVLPHVELASGSKPVIVFVGLALIIAENAIRTARK